ERAAADLGRDSHLGRQALEVVGSRPDPPPRAEVRGPIGWTLAGSAVTAIAGVGVVVAVVTGSIAPAPAAAFLVLLLGLVGWRSNLLARGMTGGLRHTYAWWGGPAWRRFPISLTARPGGSGTRFVRAVRLDPDDDDFRLVGHLTPLPGTFRSVSAGGYYDPEHPYLVSVGTPVDTTDGVRIRAEDRTLIPPEPVPRLHALVPDPVDGPATPLLPADRSRYLRFAEALTQGGTPAVVILPPLPQAAFTRALDLILNWNIGDRDHISGRRMLALQRALRGIVEEAGGTVEALCDVILYLPTESEDSR
ncbi:MAG: hypothetical protein HOY71_00670, partial [Nonomuraea sp.]|nr:hypothetical protein [Nonomuraea sp.]